MTPWKGTDAWKSLRVTVWDLDLAGSSGRTGGSCGWLRERGNTKDGPSRYSGRWCRWTHYLPLSSTWWWMRSLGRGDVRGNGQSGWEPIGGHTPRSPLLHEWRHGSVVGPRIDTGGVQHLSRAVKQVGSEDQHREDSRNVLLPVPGGRNKFRGGVRATDDRRGAFILGETACIGIVHRARGGDGTRVAISPSIDSVRKDNGPETVLGNHVP